MPLPLLFAALIAASGANLSGPSALREQTEDRVRTEVSDLIRSLCPEQCVLLSVRAAVEEQSATGPDLQPGFQALSPAGRVVTLRGVSASVLLDQQLPQPFRARFRQLASARLAGLGAPVSVDTQVVKFPPRNAPHLEAQPAPPPPPAPAAAPPTPPSLPVAAAAIPASTRAAEKLIDQAPLLVLALLLAVVAIVLGVLLLLAVRALRPQADFFEEPGGEPVPAAESAGTPPPLQTRKLEKALLSERGLRNELVRGALGRGEVQLVAAWVRELGEFLLSDLRGDSGLAPQLALLGAEVTRPEAPAARARALQELEGRLLSLRLRRSDDSADHAFDFLQGVPQERFADACGQLTDEALDVALRFAPAHLRGHAVARLPQQVRQTLALSWARRPEVSAASALSAADELRQRLEETSSGSAQRDSALGELLDALPRAEQDDLIERLRTDGDARVAEGLLGESALLGAPLEAVGATLLATPQQRVLAYLSGTDKLLRDKLLAACPPRLHAELQEELATRTPAGRDDFLASRRELLTRLKDECTSRGLSLSMPRSPGPLDQRRSVAGLGPR